MYVDQPVGGPTLDTDTTDTETIDTTSTLSKVRKALLSNTSEVIVKHSSRATVQVVAVGIVLAAIVGYVLLRLLLVVALHTLTTVFNVHVLVFSDDVVRVRVNALGSNNFRCINSVWCNSGKVSDTLVTASYRLARWALPA